MSTNLFGFSSVLEGTAQKATQFMTLLTSLFKILSFEPIPKTLAGSNITLTAAEEQSGGLVVLSGSPGATRTVSVSTTRRLWAVTNSTANTQTFKTSSGVGVNVTAGQTKILLCDGTNIIAFT